MKGRIIQAIGILLGLVVVGCSIDALIWHGAYRSGEVYHNIEAIGQTIAAMVIFFIAALLFAPERFYKQTSVRITALFFGIILAVGGVMGVLWCIAGMLSELGRTEPVLRAFAMMCGAGGLLSLACATILFIKARRARKLAP